MRRNSALAVDTTATTLNTTRDTNQSQNDLIYELTVSPRSSIYTDIDVKRDSQVSLHDDEHDTLPDSDTTPPASSSDGPTPSIRLLFSLLSQRHLLLLLLPAVLSALISGGIAPFMTFVVGQAFDAFASFPLANPTQQDKDNLLHGVGIAALELVGLAVGSLALGSLTSSLWIWTGETNVMQLRKKVYQGVAGKDMVWFDMHMGSQESSDVQAEDGPMGAGGLMAKFTRETDEVRSATSLASGTLLQYLTTTFTCLILAFMRSWALTLVILSAVPVLTIIQGFSQALASPLLAKERRHTGIAATLIDRAAAAIATVKAFNAGPHEGARADTAFTHLDQAAKRLNAVWGTTSALAQFVMMAMFVQGFWFGAKLVREGHVSAGDVMAVFWACLIATSNLQMCIPQFITLAKGKFAMAALLALVDSEAPSAPAATTPTMAHFTPMSPSSYTVVTGAQSRKSRTLRKIQPARCAGELALHNVTFAYPSRPTLPVLIDVSLFLPSGETTFIVGSSGSGKSTVAQLLMRMYEPSVGNMTLDEQDVRYLDEAWMRKHIAGVGQVGGGGVVLLEGKSVYENVLLGLSGTGRQGAAGKKEVEEACRVALIHEFVRDLPAGYETLLGGGAGGVGLSGGQKQRLAIARARLRNPSVLILDEATSALDATSRILVFEAIKRWRVGKTTIVITHDLSQIGPSDFVYVLKQGRVVEQGFRYDLEEAAPSYYAPSEDEGEGEFRKMMLAQAEMGGYLPEKELESTEEGEVARVLEEQEEELQSEESAALPKHQSMAMMRPLTFGNWMFDVVADLTSGNAATRNTICPAPAPAVVASRDAYRVSRFVPSDIGEFPPRPRRPSSIHVDIPEPTEPRPAYTVASRRLSLQFTPTSPTFHFNRSSTNMLAQGEDSYEQAFDQEKRAVERSGTSARNGRTARERTRWDGEKVIPLGSVKVHSGSMESLDNAETEEQDEPRPAFWILMRSIYPTIPHKPLLFFGLVICILSGAMTPVFSFLLSRLLFEVSTGAKDSNVINSYGGLVLGIAALDGVLIGSKYFIMETCGMAWVTKVRKSAWGKVLSQDKKWFDRPANAPSRLVQVLVKDGDDARNLIAVVWGQCLVVIAMLGVGLIWALIRGWQLTLVGFAIAPVFAITMAVQTRLVAKCEVRNKRAREEVARGYYDAISNIRGIRSMAFDSVFQAQFDAAADRALSTGVRGAFVEGCTYGVASGLIYLAEALLFYVGAVLISRGTYSYLQMVEVLNLVVFSVTIGSQLMAFTEKIAKSVQATNDLNKLIQLDTRTDESQGVLRPEISGSISFTNVQFAYPTRPEATVLRNLTFSVHEGECVAIVGASGCGKSTLTSLLQRLYEPDAGSISINDNNLRSMDVRHLREHVSVVSQHPNLFDATIAENIRYGSKLVSEVDIRRAAKAANVHEFIMSLPHGYDTMVGENAALISGGQAQRLQIARALARPCNVLILDECTSALDAENQAAVLDTIHHAKLGRTTVMVTHKMQVMRMCDRILVVHDGQLAEEGTYEELMQRKGVFATLASGGEWISD